MLNNLHKRETKQKSSQDKIKTKECMIAFHLNFGKASKMFHNSYKYYWWFIT